MPFLYLYFVLCHVKCLRMLKTLFFCILGSDEGAASSSSSNSDSSSSSSSAAAAGGRGAAAAAGTTSGRARALTRRWDKFPYKMNKYKYSFFAFVFFEGNKGPPLPRLHFLRGLSGEKEIDCIPFLEGKGGGGEKKVASPSKKFSLHLFWAAFLKYSCRLITLYEYNFFTFLHLQSLDYYIRTPMHPARFVGSHEKKVHVFKPEKVLLFSLDPVFS